MNTARTITKREGMRASTTRVMFSGCRKLMSKVGKSKEEDLSNLKWDLLLKIYNQKIFKNRNQIKIIRLKLKSAHCK